MAPRLMILRKIVTLLSLFLLITQFATEIPTEFSVTSMKIFAVDMCLTRYYNYWFTLKGTQKSIYIVIHYIPINQISLFATDLILVVSILLQAAC